MESQILEAIDYQLQAPTIFELNEWIAFHLQWSDSERSLSNYLLDVLAHFASASEFMPNTLAAGISYIVSKASLKDCSDKLEAFTLASKNQSCQTAKVIA